MFFGIFVLFFLMHLYAQDKKSRKASVLQKQQLTRISCRLTYTSGKGSLRAMVPIKVWVTLGEGFILITPYKTNISTLFFLTMFPLFLGCKSTIKINELEELKPIVPDVFTFLSPSVLKIRYRFLFFIKKQIELRSLEKDSPTSFKDQLNWCEDKK